MLKKIYAWFDPCPEEKMTGAHWLALIAFLAILILSGWGANPNV